MSAYQDLFWATPDGLTLHARDYPGGVDGRPPILCLPGLTRNARDFATLGERLSGDWRVLAVDWRGRGRSDYAKDAASYLPPTYVTDLQALLADQGIGRVVVMGTSLGGLVSMLLAAAGTPVAAAIVNDVGPELGAAGMARIRGYVGRASSFPTWIHAARAVRESHADAFPDWRIEDWLAMAKRLYRLNGAGRIVLDYDLKIAEPLRAEAEAETGLDLWPVYAALRDVPMLIVRGERSDLLSAATAERMRAAATDAELVTVPRVGHAPTLDEPVLAAPIERLLAKVR